MKKAYQKFISLIVASLLVCLFVVPERYGIAKDTFLSEYTQVIYNQSNGIGSNEVKCIYQSSSGYIWVGTDGGLYRSNGTEFQSINLWDTDRSDVYSINCIMQDSKGIVWIGTENYGLFYIENGETYHLRDEYYDGIKSIKGFCEYSDGTIYVSTSRGLYLVRFSPDDNSASLVAHPAARAAGARFGSILCFNDRLWIQRGDNEIYIMNATDVLDIISFGEISNDNIQSMELVDDNVYVGTSGNEVVEFAGKEVYKTLMSTVDGINGFMSDNTGRLWVCADNGVGFFVDEGSFVRLNELEVDNYVNDILMDYEGNYWIASNKMGLLLLSRSKFSDFNMKTGMPEAIVNCVLALGKEKYIGSEDGLRIYDADNNKVENELTELLGTTGIRHMCRDIRGTIWIATARRHGVVRVGSGGEIKNILKSDGLPSMSVNYLKPLKNGDIAIATEGGIAIADSLGNIKYVYDAEYGFSDVYINCMYEYEDNKLLIGTDGNGLFSLDLNNHSLTIYTTNDGLNSDVVKAIAEGDECIYIGTDNGLCVYNDTFRGISSIDYSNSIYDILVYDGNVWIIGSKGVLCADEETLLGNAGTVVNRYFDRNDGLNKTINTTGKSGMDINGILYICCDTGVYSLNTANIPYNTVAPRISVTSVEVDGKLYEFEDLADGLVVDSDTSRISVKFAVFSYTNRGNINVEYKLNGFDEAPIVIKGTDSMEAVYTNLDGGVYEFTVNAVNGDGISGEREVSFIIEKEKSFLEKPASRVLLAIVVIIFLVGLIYVMFRLLKNLKKKNQAFEELSKEHEEAVKSSSAKNDYLANMSNEIKTPINVMMVKAEELLNLMDKDEPYRADIEEIYSTGSGIIEKVDDIILLAKIEAGRIEVDRQSYSISDIMFELSEFATKKLVDKQVKFFVELGDSMENDVIGDAGKIKDILKRLLDNAVKYTKEGSITLSVDSFEFTDKNHQDMVNLVFTVSDTGIGIQEERLKDIFQVYNIDDNRKSNFNAGNGIGLAIAKGYSDLIGAELQADSVYGGGSTFTLSVNQRSVQNTGRNRIVAKIDEIVSKEDAEKLWLPDVKILVVDDEEQSLEITKKLLSKFEMDIDTASSGINAIDMIMNKKYDVIFMDLSLPVMNGIEVMKEIREIDEAEYMTLPIISMDMDAIDKNRDKLLEEGFTDSLVKPIDIRRAAAILKDCLPQSKIKERAASISEYIQASRYSDGIKKLLTFIDVENTIEKIGGSIEVFNKLVTVFYNQNITTIAELEKRFPKDIRGFKVKIHSLKTGSANIGAQELSQEAGKIETAINIGNREYTKENLGKLLQCLKQLLECLAEYILYVENLNGATKEKEDFMTQTVEEKDYTPTDSSDSDDDKQEQLLVEAGSVDLDMLEDIKYAALDGDYKMASEYLDILQNLEHQETDKGFIENLGKAIAEENVEDVDYLISTYIDMK